MSRLVVDASVALKWYLPESYSADARLWLGQYDVFAVPELFFAEFGNALRKQILRAGLQVDQATAVLAAARRFPWRIHSNRRLAPAALARAVELHLSVYDAFYLALASRLECQVVTADEHLYRSVAGTSEADLVAWVEHDV